MGLKTKYIRLLSYDNACKVIDWVMESGGYNYAYITVGGVGVQMPETEFESLEEFVKTLTDYYEIGNEHPTKVTDRIIENLKTNKVV